jgi:hypothetical protein
MGSPAAPTGSMRAELPVFNSCGIGPPQRVLANWPPIEPGAGYRSRIDGQPFGNASASRYSSAPTPGRSKSRCSRSTRVCAGVEAVNVTSMVLALGRIRFRLPSRADVPGEHEPVRRFPGQNPTQIRSKPMGPTFVAKPALLRFEADVLEYILPHVYSRGDQSAKCSVNRVRNAR